MTCILLLLIIPVTVSHSRRMRLAECLKLGDRYAKHGHACTVPRVDEREALLVALTLHLPCHDAWVRELQVACFPVVCGRPAGGRSRCSAAKQPHVYRHRAKGWVEFVEGPQTVGVGLSSLRVLHTRQQ